MAQRHIVTLVDDLDGGAAEETVRFGLDGSRYEIDLSKKNAAGLRDALASYVAHARRVAGDASARRADVVVRPAVIASRRRPSGPGRARTGTRSARRAEFRQPSWRPITPAVIRAVASTGLFPLSAADGPQYQHRAGQSKHSAPPGAAITPRHRLTAGKSRSVASYARRSHGKAEDDDEPLLNGDPPMQRLRAELRLRPALVAVPWNLHSYSSWATSGCSTTWSSHGRSAPAAYGVAWPSRLAGSAGCSRPSTGSPGCGWADCCTRWSGCSRRYWLVRLSVRTADPAARFLSVIGSVLIAAIMALLVTRR